MKKLDELISKLLRWAEIADKTHNEADWDKCSLLHSFGDNLARDLREAAVLLRETESKLEN